MTAIAPCLSHLDARHQDLRATAAAVWTLQIRQRNFCGPDQSNPNAIWSLECTAP